MAKKILDKLFGRVKLLILDVDGVLTKGEIIYDDTGRELKIFNVKDGLGIFLLKFAGVKTILLTAKDGAVVRKRAKDMRVEQVIAGVLPKEKAISGILKRYSVATDEICFVGDDLIDIGMMQKVGLPVAVNDAPLAVKKHAVYITKNKGGCGAVREVIDKIISYRKLGNKINAFLKNPTLL
ncbi:MAG: HAD hydrolase family protein [Candidatus Omnitrophota bacterium]